MRSLLGITGPAALAGALLLSGAPAHARAIYSLLVP